MKGVRQEVWCNETVFKQQLKGLVKEDDERTKQQRVSRGPVAFECLTTCLRTSFRHLSHLDIDHFVIVALVTTLHKNVFQFEVTMNNVCEREENESKGEKCYSL